MNQKDSSNEQLFVSSFELNIFVYLNFFFGTMFMLFELFSWLIGTIFGSFEQFCWLILTIYFSAPLNYFFNCPPPPKYASDTNCKQSGRKL